MKSIENIILGVICIIVGIILATNALGFTDINVFFDGWWTLFIIVPSVVGFFEGFKKSDCLIGVLAGLILFLWCQGIFSLDIALKLLIAMALVIVGLSFIHSGRKNEKENKDE